MIKLKKSSEFKEEIKNASKCLVKYGAPWCPPCNAIDIKLKKLTSKYTNIKFVSINIDKLKKIAKRKNINAIPVIELYKNGELAHEQIGGQNLEQLLVEFSAQPLTS